MSINRVAVLGVGLIGSSIGAALGRTGAFVTGYDSSPQSCKIALRLGHVHKVVSALEEALAGSDLVILALPVTAIAELLPAVDSLTPSEGTILDTGSVKRQVMDVASQLGGAPRVIGGHPIAGREQSGPEAADPDLYRGRPFILTPPARARPDSLATALDLVSRLGGRPLQMTPDEHDRRLARTSHLPQMLSTVLATCMSRDFDRLAGPGLEDMTRLALSDVTMWHDILLANSDNVLDAAHELSARLDQFAAAIAMKDSGAVSRTLASGREAALALRGRVE